MPVKFWNESTSTITKTYIISHILRAQNDSALEQADTVKAELDAKKQDYLNQVRNDSRIRINKELQVLVNIQAPARVSFANGYFYIIYILLLPV